MMMLMMMMCSQHDLPRLTKQKVIKTWEFRQKFDSPKKII